jgi:hypothetical protein
LGLKRGAAQAEIKDAYRVLAKVWHPDRFQGDNQLRLTAEEKLKEINSAYQLLNTTEREGTSKTSPGEHARPETSPPGTEADSSRSTYQRQHGAAFNRSFRTKRRNSKKLIAITAVILVGGGIWMYLPYGRAVVSELWTATTNHSAARQTAKPVAPHDKGQSAGTRQERNPTTEKPAPYTRANAVASDGASLVVYPADDPQVPYFTVGSTKNDVLRIQGTPTRLTGGVFEYGRSEVFFQDGRVESWFSDPSSPLKARMPQ